MKRRVSRIVRRDRRRRVDFYDHQDGFFSFEEETEFIEEVPDHGSMTTWQCTYQSGLYSDIGSAKLDAENTIGWMPSAGEGLP